MSTSEMRQKMPAASIALANEVLPPSEKGSSRSRQASPQEMIKSTGDELRRDECTIFQAQALGTAPGLRDPVFLCLVTE